MIFPQAYFVTLNFLLFPIAITVAQDCTLPKQSIVDQALRHEVFSAGGEEITIRSGSYYTCLVQGTTMGTYQELSVIMEYTSTGLDKIGQFEMICANDIWIRRQDSLTIIGFGSYDGSIGLQTDCSSCINTAGNDNNCVACNSTCNVGLMRCTGTGSDDCCIAFEYNGDCSPDLNCSGNNFIANEQNNFICTCGLSSCSDGYTFNSTSCTCYLTNICLADNPCDNNGLCTLDTTPDQYTCNCTGSYSGTNCTEFTPPIVISSMVPPGNNGGAVSSTLGIRGLMSSLAPMPTPTSSPNICVDNCNVCLNASCCMECTTNYTNIGNNCTCLLLSHSLPCPVPNCAMHMCATRTGCCDRCEDGFTNAREDHCQCVEIAVSPSSTTQPLQPTSTSTTDKLKTTDIPGIIGGLSAIIVVLSLLLIILTVLFLIYYKSRRVTRELILSQSTHQLVSISTADTHFTTDVDMIRNIAYAQLKYPQNIKQNGQRSRQVELDGNHMTDSSP